MSVRPVVVEHRRMIDAVIRLVRTLPTRLPGVRSADPSVWDAAAPIGVPVCTSDALADYAIRVSI